jgi:hypothetical protein
MKSNNPTLLGNTYMNDTGIDGKVFLTGSETFEVKEIEVFEIQKLSRSDQDALAAFEAKLRCGLHAGSLGS